jgi:hypothetical protein
MNNPIHATELVELINEKSREHSNPQNRFEYFNLMAQLARHEARHAEVSLMNKHKHKHKHVHADLMAAYAADAQTTATPWERWESCGADWFELKSHPAWNETHEYRRKTNAQIACDMLGQAHDALEEHSAEICEPNVDHIQRMVWDAMQLLAKGDVK